MHTADVEEDTNYGDVWISMIGNLNLIGRLSGFMMARLALVSKVWISWNYHKNNILNQGDFGPPFSFVTRINNRI